MKSILKILLFISIAVNLAFFFYTINQRRESIKQAELSSAIMKNNQALQLELDSIKTLTEQQRKMAERAVELSLIMKERADSLHNARKRDQE